jgi:hypothetical protein
MTITIENVSLAFQTYGSAMPLLSVSCYSIHINLTSSPDSPYSRQAIYPVLIVLIVALENSRDRDEKEFEESHTLGIQSQSIVIGSSSSDV